MNAKNPKVAIVPRGEYDTMKSGERYQVFEFSKTNFQIEINGHRHFCRVKGCAHLRGKNWILRNK